MIERRDCRLCHGDLRSVLELNWSPLANQLQAQENSGTFYPLELMECVRCRHVQLRHVVDGLFDGYLYSTPIEQTEYRQSVARRLVNRYQPETVVEIGCNNGLNLEALKTAGVRSVIGVDPAGTFWAAWRCPFTAMIAREIRDRPALSGGDMASHYRNGADLIVANNVLAHIDDLDDVFRGIADLLAKNGRLVVEFQDFNWIAQKGLFDVIYHEHLDQHTIAPWSAFLSRFGLGIERIELIAQHGRSVRLTAAFSGDLEWQEDPIDWDGFKRRMGDMIAKAKELPRCCAWGASAKLTTLIHQCGIADKIAYVVDDTPMKQGKYIPGTSIQIVPEFQPDGLPVLLGAWNYADVFRQKHPTRVGIRLHG